ESAAAGVDHGRLVLLQRFIRDQRRRPWTRERTDVFSRWQVVRLGCTGDAADAIRGRSPEMTRRRRPLRALLRFFDRALLGPILGVGAFIIERRVVRAMKAAPPKGAS